MKSHTFRAKNINYYLLHLILSKSVKIFNRVKKIDRFILAKKTCARALTITYRWSELIVDPMEGSYHYAGEHNGVAYYAGDGFTSYVYRDDKKNWHISPEKFSGPLNFWSSISDCPYDSAIWYTQMGTEWEPISGFSAKMATNGTNGN